MYLKYSLLVVGKTGTLQNEYTRSVMDPSYENLSFSEIIF